MLQHNTASIMKGLVFGFDAFLKEIFPHSSIVCLFKGPPLPLKKQLQYYQ